MHISVLTRQEETPSPPPPLFSRTLSSFTSSSLDPLPDQPFLPSLGSWRRYGVDAIGWQASLRACRAKDAQPSPPSLYLPSPPCHRGLGRGGGSRRACRSAGLTCQRAKPLPHCHRISPITATSTFTAASPIAGSHNVAT